MCILANRIAHRIFGRQHHDETGKSSPYLNRIMGPDFAGYLIDRDAHRRILTALPFEHLSLSAADGTLLAAHFYRNPISTNKTAVLVHGHGSCGFEGYASVGLKYIHHGYNILLPDNRACGESGGSWCTFGILESRDTALWTEELVRRYPADKLVLHGCSLGGATVCLMSAMNLPANVQTIVSDCAYADIRKQLGHMLKLSHVPAFPLLPEVLAWFHHFTGLSVDDCSPLQAVAKARLPILLIHGTADRYVLPENARQLYEACGSQKQLLLIEGAGHAAAHYVGGQNYEQPLFHFLAQTLKEGQPQ